MASDRSRSEEISAENVCEPISDDRIVALITSHGTRLKRSAGSYSLCPEDADDAYQRGLEILITKAPSDRPDELVPWLHTVVKHEALSIRHQRERTLTADGLDATALVGDSRGPDDIAEAGERIDRSSEAISHLKPHEMRCLMMKAHGFSYNEIAERNDWSWTKVNRCISEGRASFFKNFESIESGEQCERLAPLLSALADGEIGKDQRAAVKLHLRGCAACRARLREYRSVTAQVAEIMPPVLLGMPLIKSVGDGTLISGFRTVRDALRSVAAQGTDSFFGRAVAPLSTDPSGIGTAAKVCTGAACVLIAGGAATVGLQRGHADRIGAASQQVESHEQSTTIQPPLTSGPAPLPTQQPAESEPSGQPGEPGDGSKPGPNGDSSPQKQPSKIESNFEPDSSGAPVERTPTPGAAPPAKSTKPSTGGSEEFQP